MTSGSPGCSPDLLRVVDAVCQFGGVRALAGASLAVPAGSITGLIGPNGAGKSTLVGAIAGSVRMSRGSVVFDGEDISRLPAHQIARRGLVRTFQLASEFAGLTVLENLLVGELRMRGEGFWGALRGRRHWGPSEQAAVGRARALLDRFGMSSKEDELAGRLSGGQKRILEVMRALMARPKMLLLDEPMAGVHAGIVDRIAAHLEVLRDEGLTILMTEHELGAVERLCHPVIVLADGRVLAQGESIHEVRRRPEVLNAYLS